MSDEIKGLIKDLEKSMEKSIESMEQDFHGLRTGRASPALVEKLPVEYYGTDVPLLQLATITVPEADREGDRCFRPEADAEQRRQGDSPEHPAVDGRASP
jgi:ribosome recycling factor